MAARIATSPISVANAACSLHVIALPISRRSKRRGAGGGPAAIPAKARGFTKTTRRLEGGRNIGGTTRPTWFGTGHLAAVGATAMPRELIGPLIKVTSIGIVAALGGTFAGPTVITRRLGTMGSAGDKGSGRYPSLHGPLRLLLRSRMSHRGLMAALLVCPHAAELAGPVTLGIAAPARGSVGVLGGALRHTIKHMLLLQLLYAGIGVAAR